MQYSTFSKNVFISNRKQSLESYSRSGWEIVSTVLCYRSAMKLNATVGYLRPSVEKITTLSARDSGRNYVSRNNIYLAHNNQSAGRNEYRIRELLKYQSADWSVRKYHNKSTIRLTKLNVVKMAQQLVNSSADYSLRYILKLVSW